MMKLNYQKFKKNDAIFIEVKHRKLQSVSKNKLITSVRGAYLGDVDLELDLLSHLVSRPKKINSVSDWIDDLLTKERPEYDLHHIIDGWVYTTNGQQVRGAKIPNPDVAGKARGAYNIKKGHGETEYTRMQDALELARVVLLHVIPYESVEVCDTVEGVLISGHNKPTITKVIRVEVLGRVAFYDAEDLNKNLAHGAQSYEDKRFLKVSMDKMAVGNRSDQRAFVQLPIFSEVI